YTDLDAGILTGASIGDYVWEDLNGDGIQDAGESGVGGVTVTLLDGDGATVGTTTTAADGSYSFTDLEPGDYSVVFFDLPMGYNFTDQDAGGDDTLDSDANPADGSTAIVTLESGDNYTDLDAGILTGASIGDYVWEDLNGDGIQDAGEPGVGGVTVTLLDGDGATVGTTTTAADGSYSFTDLEPGDYSVVFSDLPMGYDFTDQDAGGNDALDSDANPVDGSTATVTLESGDNYTDLDAGILTGASLGDYVWEDLNGDGIQDAGEPGVGGVTVTLLDGDGATVGTTTTAADGSYSFTNLEPGDYSVVFSDLPMGYNFTDQDAGGNDALDSDANPADGSTATVTLESGDNYTDLDAGILTGASLGDYVWEDLNGDGIQDAGEPGVSGVTVTLLDGDGATVGTTT
ncbi:SdrD B-like domain-containing protein, partial [Flavilitoribacter nigricans]|uniref:SdrD B-like domain-containing protein n=1 Tax=Flavilitoribacter nigricans TaxID=70997 RepID=UPI001628C3A2